MRLSFLLNRAGGPRKSPGARQKLYVTDNAGGGRGWVEKAPDGRRENKNRKRRNAGRRGNRRRLPSRIGRKRLGRRRRSHGREGERSLARNGGGRMGNGRGDKRTRGERVWGNGRNTSERLGSGSAYRMRHACGVGGWAVFVLHSWQRQNLQRGSKKFLREILPRAHSLAALGARSLALLAKNRPSPWGEARQKEESCMGLPGVGQAATD